MAHNLLTRKIGFFSATNIVVANMIGAGIFTTSGLLLAGLHDPILMVVLWFVGGIIALCGALSYGTLGTIMPEAGGEYLFLSKLFHPFFGFLSGWVSFIVGFSAPIAASAIGFSEYLVRAFPVIQDFLSFIPANNQGLIIKLISAVVIILFTFLHAHGLKKGVFVQNLLTLFKIGIILIIIGAAVFWGQGSFSHFIFSGNSIKTGTDWQVIGISLMWIMFAYSGWNASTYIGSEIKNPAKNLPLSLIVGTGIVMVLYVLLNMVFVYAIPPNEMAGEISVGGLAMGKMFGEGAETLFSLFIAVALFSSLSAFIIIGPRVYYAMAKDVLFFKALAKVHPTYKVPLKAIYLQGLIAVVYVLSGTFEQIITYMGFSLGIFPIMTVAGLFIIRKKDRAKLIKIPGYPYVQVFFILISLVILVLAFMYKPLESGIAIGAMLAGIPVYLYFDKRKKQLVS